MHWVEKNIEETLTFYRLPLSHHKHMKSSNMLERLNQEIKRRTLVVRIFPSQPSCLRLVRALAVETHEEWLQSTRYLNMEDLTRAQEGEPEGIGRLIPPAAHGCCAAKHGGCAAVTHQRHCKAIFAELDAHN